MSFRDLNIQLRYRTDVNDFPRDFLLPVLMNTKEYRRGTGYFSTSSLVQLSIGLFELAKNQGKIKVICSPNLDEEDIKAIDFGYKTRDEVFSEVMLGELNSPLNEYEEERLNLVATLIANGTLDIKLAFMEDEDGIKLYHEKIAIFDDFDGNRICFAGSPNESYNGISGNFESFYTFCDWKDTSQKDGVSITVEDFEQMWNNNTEKLKVIPFPEIVIEKLLKYKKETVDWETDIKEFNLRSILKVNSLFHRPNNVKMLDYQKLAVKQWFDNNNRGIFDMCTGAGKTYTALDAMVQLALKKEDHLAVFIVCPQIHLVGQWEEDLVNWTNAPIIIAHSKSSNSLWKEDLLKSYKKFKKNGKPFVCVTTNDTFSSSEIQQYITRFNPESNVLLIVDEAHNFGSQSMINIMPWNIANRIALSATIERYMDKHGTEMLYKFFGNKCLTYTLDEAIHNGNLVHYDYFPVVVTLNNYELDKYKELTRKLKNYIVSDDGKIKISEAGKFIIYERTRLLAGAEAKTNLLLETIKPYIEDNNILVYCGATQIENDSTGELVKQVDVITNKLREEYHMSVKRFTADESLEDRNNIKEFFAKGMYQVITAIKCLDEGVNIPGIKTAFIMSSSKNPKEYIQRRGRLLRKSDGKEKAVIYDFITLPRDLNNANYSDLEFDKTILVGEIYRMTEFARLADNPEVALSLSNDIMTAYDYYFDPIEEVEKMEEYYNV